MTERDLDNLISEYRRERKELLNILQIDRRELLIMNERDLDNLIAEYRRKRKEILNILQHIAEASAQIQIESKSSGGELTTEQDRRYTKLLYIREKIINSL